MHMLSEYTNAHVCIVNIQTHTYAYARLHACVYIYVNIQTHTYAYAK